MTLSVFLGICISLLVFTLCFCIVERTKIFPDVKDHDIINRKLRDKSNKGIMFKVVFFVLFAFLSVCALWTAKSYIYPADTDNDSSAFTNVRYHVLSHEGYLLGNQFYLAHGVTNTSSGFPNEALWDNKDGIVKLQRTDSSITIEQFTEPVYVRQSKKRFLRDAKHTYHLANSVIGEDVSKGFRLFKDSILKYELEIENYDPCFWTKLTTNDERLKKKQVFYISKLYISPDSCIRDTSSFNRVIKIGYPLLEIIAHSPRIDVTEEMEQWFSNCYLVRQSIPMEGNVFSYDEDNPSALCIMPGISFYIQDGLSINNKVANFDSIFVVKFADYAYEDKVTFFSGIGSHRSEEFRLTYPDEGHMRLEFLQKDMRQLREMGGRVFITSSIDEVSENGQEGGYLYNKFNDEKNFNHINGTIRYNVGSARDSLCFALLDLNNQLTGERHIYHSDEEFMLHSRNKADNSISWIFRMTNLRETNDLKIQHIIWFILLMLLAVAIRIAVDTIFELRSLSIFEYGLYVVLFGLSIVRLILGWRASTFVPIENIALPTYLKMRASIYDWTFVIVWLLPILVSVYAYLSKLSDQKGWDKKIEEKIHSSWTKFCDTILNWVKTYKKYLIGAENADEYSVITALYIFLLIGCMSLKILPISQLERLCNIVFPALLYFLTDIWIEIRLARSSNHNKSLNIRRYIHAAIAFVYFGVSDAGFTIVFLTCFLLQEGVLKGLFNKKSHLSGWKKWSRYVISSGYIVLIYLFLRYEGDIMISIFKYAGIWATGFGIAFTIIMAKIATKKKAPILWIVVALFSIITALGIVDATTNFNPITEVVNKKAHMKYRAEIQQLGKGEKIDDIIERSEYDSGDIVFIMRSAHNQWFINQYIRAGQDMIASGENFKLQPHSNQGCTFTTQTTDLVVTRYILAEHGEVVARRIMELWALLILLFIMEVMMSDGINIACIGSGLLIYVVSLLVYLSATNRIVFIGQDFPMISLQSRIAVLLPYLLFCIPLFRAVYVRQNRRDDGDDKETDIKGLVFGGMLIIITSLSIAGIEQKGREQEASQFNVSTLISNVSEKVSLINDHFVTYQWENIDTLKRKRIVDVWNSFVEDGYYSKAYFEMLNSEDAENRFFSSALRYFDSKQVSKTDVNKLLHLRRRGGICYLSVNKQHYFIPAIMKEEMSWKGNLYSAYIDHNFALFGLNNSSMINLDSNRDYEKNILHGSVKEQIPNLPLARFDSEWTPTDKPLLLLQSIQGDNQSEYFCIEADTLELMSLGKSNQISTALEPGDVFSLNYAAQSGNRQPRTVYSAKLQENGQKFIARNIWLNGHRKLFYPLGKQSMWTYHYANLVSSALGEKSHESEYTHYRDTSLNLSIDYDLCKALYETMEDEAYDSRRNHIISDKVRMQLEAFRDAKTEVQIDSIHRDMYYDKTRNKIVVKDRSRQTAELRQITKQVNKHLRALSYSEKPLSDAIDRVLQRPYDFTAIAIDGDGHIRALFDYTQRRRIDPNNIDNLSKLISELYIDGSSEDERDLFGSKALQHIPMGPGSSFKPIAYTAITSQEHLDWKTININLHGVEVAKTQKESNSTSKVERFRYYGGMDIEKKLYEPPLSIGLDGGYQWNNYLIKSDNLYHSVVIMLGLQPKGHVTDVMRSPSGLQPEIAFPIFTYKGKQCSFDLEVWYRNEEGLIRSNSILTWGLYHNFRIHEGANRVATHVYQNYFGNDSITNYVYNYPSSARGWSFAEVGSLNTADRKHKPIMQNGFNRMLLGAYPLQQTPLQMATNAVRLISLNKAEQITTLVDGEFEKEYEFFELGEGWDENSFLQHMKDVVWSQMRQVTLNAQRGTARALNDFTLRVASGKYGKPYYLYCKTGTLNDERDNQKRNRIKHLMVIITDKQLEQVTTIEQLQKVKYYAVYLSYMGVDVDEFNNSYFQPYIENVLTSATFKAYMNPQKK